MKRIIPALLFFALLALPPAFSQDVRNTYVGVAAQIADGIITNTKLQNSSMTIAGHSIALGATQTIACADLSDGATGCSTTVTDTTWTPTITTDGTAGTPTYSNQTGHYTKVGHQVTAWFVLALSNWTGSPSGSVHISIPFTADYNGSCLFHYFGVTSFTASETTITGRIDPSTAYFVVAQTIGVNNLTLLSATQAGTTFVIQGTCMFHTAS